MKRKYSPQLHLSCISDFKEALRKELLSLPISTAQLAEIKSHLAKEPTDYHSLQSIIDLLLSISDISEQLVEFCNQIRY